jgi:anti-anti-sigma factor
MVQGKVIDMNPPKTGAVKPGARAVVAPKESITYQNVVQYKVQFEEFLNQNKTEILLDLKAVPYLDSAALELLAKIHEELKGRGGHLKLFGMNAVCKDILTATRLVNVLHLYNDIHGAMRGGL